jgi:hypothetical protein
MALTCEIDQGKKAKKFTTALFMDMNSRLTMYLKTTSSKLYDNWDTQLQWHSG